MIKIGSRVEVACSHWLHAETGTVIDIEQRSGKQYYIVRHDKTALGDSAFRADEVKALPSKFQINDLVSVDVQEASRYSGAIGIVVGADNDGKRVAVKFHDYPSGAKSYATPAIVWFVSDMLINHTRRSL